MRIKIIYRLIHFFGFVCLHIDMDISCHVMQVYVQKKKRDHFVVSCWIIGHGSCSPNLACSINLCYNTMCRIKYFCRCTACCYVVNNWVQLWGILYQSNSQPFRPFWTANLTEVTLLFHIRKTVEIDLVIFEKSAKRVIRGFAKLKITENLTAKSRLNEISIFYCCCVYSWRAVRFDAVICQLTTLFGVYLFFSTLH